MRSTVGLPPSVRFSLLQREEPLWIRPEALEAAERGVPGAEVIDHQRHAQRAGGRQTPPGRPRFRPWPHPRWSQGKVYRLESGVGPASSAMRMMAPQWQCPEVLAPALPATASMPPPVDPDPDGRPTATGLRSASHPSQERGRERRFALRAFCGRPGFSRVVPQLREGPILGEHGVTCGISSHE